MRFPRASELAEASLNVLRRHSGTVIFYRDGSSSNAILIVFNIDTRGISIKGIPNDLRNGWNWP